MTKKLLIFVPLFLALFAGTSTHADQFLAAEGYKATWVTQTQSGTEHQYFSIEPCGVVEFNATFKNTGSLPWEAEGDNQVAFNIYKDGKVISYPEGFSYEAGEAESFFQHTSWLTPFRIGTLSEDVAVGDETVIPMQFQIPCDAQPGIYREDISMAVGDYWMPNKENGDPLGVAHIWVGFVIGDLEEALLNMPQSFRFSTTAKSPFTTVIPASKILPIKLYRQGWNNCGPTTTQMMLKYYGISKTQDELATYLRGGHYDDKHVHLEQVGEYVAKYGLSSIIRVNGDIDKVKALIAQDIPVIIYQQLHVGDDIGHYRIARGYNSNTIYTADSYKGVYREYNHRDFNLMWAPQNYRYMPIYQPEKEGMVKKILGKDWVEKIAYENALAYELKMIKKYPDRSYHALNIGENLAALGQWEKAKEYYEKAKAIGFPKRTLWYIHWPVTTYNQLGEYDTAIAMVDAVQAGGNKYPGELLYEEAYAYWKKGDKTQAWKILVIAIYYEPNYLPLQELKKEIEEEA